jgi:multidrug resistance efflux pump
MPLWRSIGQAKWVLQARTLPKTLAVLGCILALLAFLCFFPWDFNLKAEGTIFPKDRREIFAKTDGKVTEVFVEHRQRVTRGQELVRLENPDLTTELARIQGELEEAREQAATYDYQQTNASALERSDRMSLAKESSAVKGRIMTLEGQERLQKEEVENLTITSPIDGEVITWDVKRMLLYRPVSRGNLLMTIANPNSEWELEVFMEEDRMGHVRRALPDDPNEPMKVTYILASNPKRKLEGKLYAKNIHDQAQVHEEYGHSVRLSIVVDKNDVQDLLIGTEVTAKVFCGRRSFGYVWFHEMIEFFQAKVFF